MDELLHHVSVHAEATSQWDAFMDAWRMNVLREKKKKLSHYGALPTTLPWEPRHWTSGDAESTSSGLGNCVLGDAKSAPGVREWYFDAGNDVYAFCIQLVFPNAASTRRHNREYLGDVLEAILGLCWISQQSIKLAMLLQRASKLLYGLKAWLVLGSFDHHENRMAVYRFIAEHSQFGREAEGATPGGAGCTSDAFERTADHERCSFGGSRSTSDFALFSEWYEESDGQHLLDLLNKLHQHPDAFPLLGQSDQDRRIGGEEPADRDREVKTSKDTESLADTRPIDEAPRGWCVSAPPRKELQRVSCRSGKLKDVVESLRLSDAAQRRHDLEHAKARKRKAVLKPADADQRDGSSKKARRNDPERTAAWQRHSLGLDKTAKSTTHTLIEGLPTIVKMFTKGWFPSEVARLLDQAAAEVYALGNSSMLRSVEGFTKAVLRAGEHSEGNWNTSLKDVLSQLFLIRRYYANDFSPLSRSQTQACLWSFARAFRLSRRELQLPKKKQRRLINCILQAQCGCYYRLRAVLRIGLQGFEHVRDKSVLLERFLHYIHQIEETAKRFKKDEKRIFDHGLASAPLGDPDTNSKPTRRSSALAPRPSEETAWNYDDDGDDAAGNSIDAASVSLVIIDPLHAE